MQPIFDLEMIEKLKQVQQAGVNYPLMGTIHYEMHKAVQINRYLRTPRVIVITGTYRAGKSHIVGEFAAEYPADRTGETVQRPVLYLVVPERATLISLLIEMLTRLGDPVPTKGTKDAKKIRLRKLLRDCGVQLIIFDEFNHIYDRDNEEVQHEVTNFIKVLIKGDPNDDPAENFLPISSVFAGLPYLTQIFQVNEQLGSLAPDPYVIDPFTWNPAKPKTGEQYRKFLAEFEQQMPFEERSNLSNEDLAWRCFVATHGKMGYTAMLLRAAAELVVEKKQKGFSQQLLATAFFSTLSSERLHTKNPFVGKSPTDAGQPEKDYTPPSSTSKRGRGRRK
jgi:hypothetical protein